jgi:hypothetical protein
VKQQTSNQKLGDNKQQEMAMKTLLFVLGLLLATTTIAPRAQAQSNYPWCAYYGSGFSGTNCDFVSFEQCLENVRGIGGFCQQSRGQWPQMLRVFRI